MCDDIFQIGMTDAKQWVSSNSCAAAYTARLVGSAGANLVSSFFVCGFSLCNLSVSNFGSAVSKLATAANVAGSHAACYCQYTAAIATQGRQIVMFWQYLQVQRLYVLGGSATTL
jgi:hypothetical protein